MVKQHQLVIILPEDMADIPVRVINNPDSMELVLTTLPSDGTPAVRSERMERKYAFVWHHEDYIKVALDEICWIEASGSYSIIHLTRKRKLTVSCNLAAKFLIISVPNY